MEGLADYFRVARHSGKIVQGVRNRYIIIAKETPLPSIPQCFDRLCLSVISPILANQMVALRLPPPC
jgi:hypothetical protein